MHEMIDLAWNDRNLLRDADVVNRLNLDAPTRCANSWNYP